MDTPHTPVHGTISPQCLHDLRTLLGDRLSLSQAVRAQYATGEAFPEAYPPDAVAFPLTTEEVSQIAALCTRYRVPMIASGAGTSLEGHITAPLGGLAINLARMDAILDVSADNMDVLVEAGVTREQLNHDLRHQGLFFPIDPGANASIGGMASTRASGTNAVRYGTMAHNVLGLTVVQPDGTVIRTGGRARKSAAGYDLTHLYIGSEGTLGIITEIRLKLHGLPAAIGAATCAFDTIGGAITAVQQIMLSGIPVARVEFLDQAQVRACNAWSQLGLPDKPHLFIEFHGSDASVAEQAEMAAEIAADNGGEGFQWATAAEDRSRLWKARHNAYFASKSLRPGAVVWSSDVCVPLSHLHEAVTAVHADIAREGLLAPIVGHVGDGNFHVLFCLDPNAPEERARAKKVYQAMIERALACGGTCTGEHGIGLNKREYLVQEHSADAVATMRAIKQTLDPHNLMNPQKIFLPG
ncbi:2-hydroxy-acid oxidase [Asticcacaulis sp. AC460]|uniref:FAD-binding oxidoreductase n=1 Tax=Asticcacaulis sp. AC460 TaxID=1282360 RepID=UPI0003C3C49F|nr:FAD-linked oxidase C-terminal domain-containing protein [Asticcacaulis sp. AC460]ESQ88488.1 2-hydroxy-acid oxidase [Asticcacaulis sp. AC460]